MDFEVRLGIESNLLSFTRIKVVSALFIMTL